jgi:hypothetical protein
MTNETITITSLPFMSVLLSPSFLFLSFLCLPVRLLLPIEMALQNQSLFSTGFTI